ncbi:MAG: HU family DNA-binding protein [candidate division Zixibacteria bacterium]|nr:HU family DNA-binding protein [candidate division Zixibacteria bacterium]
MTKEELINKIAKEAKVTKVQANKAASAFFDGVTSSLKRGRKVSFVGFGTFSVAKRKARMGRNPQTGAPIRIAASKVPKFKAGKQLRDAVK